MAIYSGYNRGQTGNNSEEIWVLKGNFQPENEAHRTKMAAMLQPGMLSHREQTMASDDYPDWLTAEHRTGVR